MMNDDFCHHNSERKAVDLQEYQEAINLLESGDRAEGADRLIALVGRNTSCWEAYNDLAAIAMQQDQLDTAEELLRAAVARAPQPGKATLNLATLLALRNDSDEALKTLSPLIRHDPSCFEAISLVRQILEKTESISPIAWASLVAALRCPQRDDLSEPAATTRDSAPPPKTASPIAPSSVLDNYVGAAPSNQNVLEIFQGNWSSAMPSSSGLASAPGVAKLFEDHRVKWAVDVLGPVTDKEILELGPLEGGHTYQLHALGAGSITAIEANTQAYLKTLCVKEIFNLKRAKILLGDFIAYLESTTQRYDLIFASGVLYHMKDPLKLLELLCSHTDRIYIWTHYYDPAIKSMPAIEGKFQEPEFIRFNGVNVQWAVQNYQDALNWSGFCGGPEEFSRWLSKNSILNVLRSFGFNSIKVCHDQIDHPNGPAFSIAAERKNARRVSVPSELSRNEKILSGIQRNGKGIEIGPSFSPVTPKSGGFDVITIDHCTAEELRKKYANHNVDISKIEEVDYVWSGQALTELVGDCGTYDWIIASHVIEHIPDLVRFLRECEQLLSPEGTLALAVPDKRYCFDRYRPTSTTGGLLTAWAEKRIRPTAGQVFDHFADTVNKNGMIAWGQDESHDNLTLNHRLDEATSIYANTINSNKYVDVHCWQFTPNSFRLIISDLATLGLISFVIDNEHPTIGCEFLVTLRKKESPAHPIERIESLKRIHG